MMRRLALPSSLLILCLLAPPACGEDTAVEGADPVTTDSGNQGEGDIITPDDAAEDGGVLDATTPPDADGPVDAGPDTAGDSTADASEDVPPVIDCPGGPGCSCTANNDCDIALCIEVGAGKQCAAKCVDECPTGFQCVPAGSGDVVSICAPLYDRLCNPCDKSEACRGIGLEKASCIDYGILGAFCGLPCVDDGTCPQGYECKAVKAVEGKVSQQCVRKPDNASGKPGLCTCTEGAKAKQLETSCSIENKNAKGEVIGLCPGTRSCGENGLSDCIGPPPELETCDGIDNDCDGKTDENTCNDGNGCTADACDPSKAGGGKDGCVHSKLDGACDADGSVCTEKDKCVDGICTPGKAKACDDDNPCTLDGCDPAKGCTVTDDDGKACDDDNGCTQGDTCKAGACKAGKAKACGTGDPCVAGKCNLATGKCAYKDLTAACDDGNPCTQADVCDGGFCGGKPVDCDDKNPCTADVCKTGSGCQHNPNTAPCDDGSACTKSDGCKGGACVGLPLNVTVDCDDKKVCTTDTCDPKTGCVHSNNALGCDDGNPCTNGDLCKAGVCTSGANLCGCNKDADCAAKEDGDLCNGTLYCDTAKAPYSCKVNPKTPVTCDTKGDTICKATACAPKTGKCVATAAADGKACDADGSVCSKGDACKGGLCTAGAAVKCDDGNACTTDSCDKIKGCVHVNSTAGCNADDNACTVGDQCQAGVCLPGKAKLCGDGNSCTSEKCSVSTGKCVYTNAPDKAPCDADGSACTAGDACKGGTCAAGKPLVCDDAKPCTLDSCDAKAGCVYKNKVGACDDGNPCTSGDACNAGACVPGKNVCGCQKDADCAAKEDGDLCNGTLVCDTAKAPFQCKVDPKTVVKCSTSEDGPCFNNQCQAKTGKCSLVAIGAGKSCDDGDACTAGDACGKDAGGKHGCQPGKAVVCDDKNVCTQDQCDKAKGCVTSVDTNKPYTCYDGPKDTAGKGECKAGQRTCKADGSFGPCTGQVVPAKSELCNGKDDTCDGKVDTGCKPVDFAASQAGVAFTGTSGKLQLNALVGAGGPVGETAGKGKHKAELGFAAWLRGLLGK